MLIKIMFFVFCYIVIAVITDAYLHAKFYEDIHRRSGVSDSFFDVILTVFSIFWALAIPMLIIGIPIGWLWDKMFGLFMRGKDD